MGWAPPLPVSFCPDSTRFDANGEGSIPSPPVFDAFRRNQRGFNPSPVVFDALASAQRRNEEGKSLLVTSIWPTRRGRGWVQPSPIGFDVFRRVRGVFNLSSSSRRERERVQPLIVRFRPGWTRTRRGLIPPRLFSTRFDANGDGVNPFPFFFDVFRRERGGINPPCSLSMCQGVSTHPGTSFFVFYDVPELPYCTLAVYLL